MQEKCEIFLLFILYSNTKIKQSKMTDGFYIT
jgi:hypothetical protein